MWSRWLRSWYQSVLLTSTTLIVKHHVVWGWPASAWVVQEEILGEIWILLLVEWLLLLLLLLLLEIGSSTSKARLDLRWGRRYRSSLAIETRDHLRLILLLWFKNIFALLVMTSCVMHVILMIRSFLNSMVLKLRHVVGILVVLRHYHSTSCLLLLSCVVDTAKSTIRKCLLHRLCIRFFKANLTVGGYGTLFLKLLLLLNWLFRFWCGLPWNSYYYYCWWNLDPNWVFVWRMMSYYRKSSYCLDVILLYLDGAMQHQRRGSTHYILWPCISGYSSRLSGTCRFLALSGHYLTSFLREIIAGCGSWIIHYRRDFKFFIII